MTLGAQRQVHSTRTLFSKHIETTSLRTCLSLSSPTSFDQSSDYAKQMIWPSGCLDQDMYNCIPARGKFGRE